MATKPTKELTITGKIALPDDHFDQAALLHSARDVIREAEAQLSEKLGTEFKFETMISAPRGKRTSTNGSGAGQPRQRKTSAAEQQPGVGAPPAA